MFEPAEVLRTATVYPPTSVNVPLVVVLIGFWLDVVPSQEVASVGRLAVVPPGSEHSRMVSPVASSEGGGNPVPETAIVCPFEKGPEGIVTVGLAAKAWPGRKAKPRATQMKASPAT
jgi:hypothetical protein